jgi:hypothetical protein
MLMVEPTTLTKVGSTLPLTNSVDPFVRVSEPMSITAALKASVELEAVTLLKPEKTCDLDPPAARSVPLMLATAFVPLNRTPLAKLSGEAEAGSLITRVLPAIPTMLPPILPPVRVTVSASTSPLIAPP